MKRLACLLILLVLGACAGGSSNSPTPAANQPRPDHGAIKALASLPADGHKLAERGRELFGRNSCANCHALKDGAGAMSGPALTRVGRDYLDHASGDELEARRALFRHLRSPRDHPGLKSRRQRFTAEMPAYGESLLPDADAVALVEFLMTLR
jgi:mono/diheme cytochrome c family protein